MSTKKHQESLSSVTKNLMLLEPFYGLFLLGLNKIWAPVKTANVSLDGINYYLKIDPDFWDPLTHDERMGLIKHELLHIAFFHLTDFSQLSNKQVANMAMDIEINQYIDRSWLPEGGLLPETFPELKLEPNKGTLYYYEKLMESDHPATKDKLEIIINALGNGDTSVQLPDGQTITLTNHDWEEVENNMDEATKRLVKAQLQHIMEETAEAVTKSQGSVPGEIAQILKQLQELDPPKFDWKGYMRRFVGRSVQTYTRKSRRKYNKRMPDNPGLKLKQRKHILVAIDTSGSVSTAELKEFLNEIHHMKKTGSEVTIVQCDTAISYIGKFDPRKDFEVHGRGGTSFQPVIDYYDANVEKYSCCFYLTDGEAWAPSKPRGPILWVLSSVSQKTDQLPGPTIKLDI